MKWSQKIRDENFFLQLLKYIYGMMILDLVVVADVIVAVVVVLVVAVVV